MSKLNMDLVRKTKQEMETRSAKGAPGGLIGSVKWFRPKNGDTKVRVLPSWTAEGEYSGQFWREVAQHWNVSDDQKAPIMCPKTTPGINEDCPICDFVAELRQQKNDPSALALAKDLRAKRCFFLNIIDLDDPVYTAKDVVEWKKERPDNDVPFSADEPKVQVYACPPTVFDAILNIVAQNEIDITDLETGYNVTLSKVPGKDKMLTTYKVTAALKPTKAPLSDEKLIHDLSKIGAVMSYEKMTTILASGIGGEYAALPPGSTKALPKTTVTYVNNSDDLPASYGGKSAEDDLEAQMRAQLSS